MNQVSLLPFGILKSYVISRTNIFEILKEIGDGFPLAIGQDGLV